MLIYGLVFIGDGYLHLSTKGDVIHCNRVIL